MIRTTRSIAVAFAVTFAIFHAAAAGATVFYVSPDGAGTNSGLTEATPWSLNKANASLTPGDVCVMLPGTYPLTIDPRESGVKGRRITFVGDLADPGRVVVPGIELASSNVSVKGVRSTSGAAIKYPALFDSIAYCITAGISFSAAKHSVVARNVIQGNVKFAANDGRACFNGQTPDPGCFANSEYDTLSENHIDLGVMGPGARAFQLRGFTKDCVIAANRIQGTFDNGASTSPDAALALVTYNSHSCTFRDNRWEFEALSDHNSQYQMWNAVYLRDSTSFFLFERDTMLLALNSEHEVRGIISASGSFPQSVSSNRWNGCYIKMNGYLMTQDRFENCLIENSVLATDRGNALWFAGPFSNSKLEHNVFYSPGQSLRFDEAISGEGSTVTSNIFYSTDAQAAAGNGGQVQFGRSQSGFTSDYNVFYSPSFDSAPGDRSIVWCCYRSSAPGGGTAWNDYSGQDGNSRYGSPLFLDSSFATLDPRLGPGSPAIGAGSGGADAGPVPFLDLGIDRVPPWPVTDFRGEVGARRAP